MFRAKKKVSIKISSSDLSRLSSISLKKYTANFKAGIATFLLAVILSFSATLAIKKITVNNFMVKRCEILIKFSTIIYQLINCCNYILGIIFISMFFKNCLNFSGKFDLGKGCIAFDVTKAHLKEHKKKIILIKFLENLKSCLKHFKFNSFCFIKFYILKLIFCVLA